jgi:hypothetical protein
VLLIHMSVVLQSRSRGEVAGRRSLMVTAICESGADERRGGSGGGLVSVQVDKHCSLDCACVCMGSREIGERRLVVVVSAGRACESVGR